MPLPRDEVDAPPDLRVPDERLAPELDDFVRVLPDFVVPPLDAPDRAVLGLAPVDFEAALLDRLAVDPLAVDPLVVEPDRDDALRPPLDRLALLRDDDDPDASLPVDAVTLHLPDITRCAASATASAISEPSFAALDATLLAACCAVSAASSPASRIALRAFGLALIAAAAAARPAASISLLIAALASLSTVVSLELERDRDEPEPELDELEREELLRVDLAIANLPPLRG